MPTHEPSSNDATPSPNLPHLLPLARAGDKEAQLFLVTAFTPLVRKLASQERDLSLREDLVSTLKLAVLEAIRKYPGQDMDRFPGYLKKYLLQTLSYYKRRQVRQKRLHEKLNTLERTNPVYIEDFGRAERHRQLKEAYESLPPGERRLVYFAAIDDDSTWNDISREFGVPVSTLFRRYRKALRAMKDVLSGNADRTEDSG